ncbi:MAG TPA: ChbG/HpnK family deacetylase [Acidobacteriaceae bacterium]|nr:ChbG/HpnK family deacetylase [Acidobacteriaceae bacterium]
MPVRRLIVNADDFGLTDGINRAVRDLHQLGALTSTTLMAAAPRFDEAVEISQQQKTLGVGCHIVLVDGTPVAHPAAIPTLLDTSRQPGDDPRFRATLGEFVRDLYCGRIDSTHIEREAMAQIQRLQQAGVAVTHVDTHKHTHMFPRVLNGVVRAARACHIRTIRNPFEPPWSVAATPGAGLVRTWQVRLLATLQHSFWKLIRQQEFSTTDGCVGVAATGTLNEATLRALLNRMPDGTFELVCHPAYMDEELLATRTRLQQSRPIELAALQALPSMFGSVKLPVQLIDFGRLATRVATPEP